MSTSIPRHSRPVEVPVESAKRAPRHSPSSAAGGSNPAQSPKRPWFSADRSRPFTSPALEERLAPWSRARDLRLISRARGCASETSGTDGRVWPLVPFNGGSHAFARATRQSGNDHRYVRWRPQRRKHISPFTPDPRLPGPGSFERHAKVKAHKGSSTVVFDHVATGTYAVGACHDETRRTARHGFLGLSRRGDIDY
jgi:hypothetical protein